MNQSYIIHLVCLHKCSQLSHGKTDQRFSTFGCYGNENMSGCIWLCSQVQKMELASMMACCCEKENLQTKRKRNGAGVNWADLWVMDIDMTQTFCEAAASGEDRNDIQVWLKNYMGPRNYLPSRIQRDKSKAWRDEHVVWSLYRTYELRETSNNICSGLTNVEDWFISQLVFLQVGFGFVFLCLWIWPNKFFRKFIGISQCQKPVSAMIG